MTAAESSVMELFRHYDTEPRQMLFFGANNCKMSTDQLRRAMRSLIDRGLVTEERPNQAYALTARGYRISLAMCRGVRQ